MCKADPKISSMLEWLNNEKTATGYPVGDCRQWFKKSKVKVTIDFFVVAALSTQRPRLRCSLIDDLTDVREGGGGGNVLN